MGVSGRTARQVGNALLGWAVVGVLVALSVRSIRWIDPFWGGLTLLVLVVAVAPAVVARSWRRTPPWPLLVFGAAPLLTRAYGPTATLEAVWRAVLATDGTVQRLAADAGLRADVGLLTEEMVARAVFVLFAFADAIVVATLALLVVAEIQRFTSLRLTLRFASLFVGVVTVGLVGLWAVVRWVSDSYLGTAFLEGNAALMAEFSAATAAAVVAGVVVAPLFCRSRGIRLTRGVEGVERTPRPARGRFGRVDRLLARVLQLVVVGVLAFGVHTENVTMVANGVLALTVTQLPALFGGSARRTVDGRLVLWISVAAVFHAIGTLGPYWQFVWWDDVAHALSASVVAAVGYTAARVLDRRDERLGLPSGFLFLYLLLFVVTAGVVWELFEFALSGVTRYGYTPPLVQEGLEDTVTDLVFDVTGGLVVAVGSVLYQWTATSQRASVEPVRAGD